MAPPRRSIQKHLQGSASSPLKLTQSDEPELPKTMEEWEAVPKVPDGSVTFKNSLEHASKIKNMLEKGIIKLSVPPLAIRNFFPFLHQYKYTSFQGWMYRIRKSLRPPAVQGAEDDSITPNDIRGFPGGKWFFSFIKKDHDHH